MFTGRARSAPRCRYCLAVTHGSADCAYAPTDGRASRSPLLGTSRPMGPPSLPSFRPSYSRPQPPSAMEICRLFNHPGGSQCKFPTCRHAHLCAKCHRPGPTLHQSATGAGLLTACHPCPDRDDPSRAPERIWAPAAAAASHTRPYCCLCCRCMHTCCSYYYLCIPAATIIASAYRLLLCPMLMLWCRVVSLRCLFTW